MSKEEIKRIMAGKIETREEAIALGMTAFWEREDWTPEEVALAQLNQERLVVFPLKVFHEAVEKLLGRDVWSHEFARPDLLLAEYEGSRSAPASPFHSLAEIRPDAKVIPVSLD